MHWLQQNYGVPLHCIQLVILKCVSVLHASYTCISRGYCIKVVSAYASHRHLRPFGSNPSNVVRIVLRDDSYEFPKYRVLFWNKRSWRSFEYYLVFISLTQ